MPILPFYGSRHRDLFAIEQAAMDRPGRVRQALDRLLPRSGRLLDIGAGNGLLAARLSTPDRSVLPLEPDPGMVDRTLALAWVSGEAEALPFRSASFDAAYAAWACFFPRHHSIETAVREAERVLEPGGILAILDNLGGDELCGLSSSDISEPVGPFTALGFSLEIVDTCFEFGSMADARRLLGFYFGPSGRRGAKLRLSYRVGLFHKRRAVVRLAGDDELRV